MKLPSLPLVRRLATRRRNPRPHAIRKPKGYRVAAPGDLVQLDTQQQRPLPGDVLDEYNHLSQQGFAGMLASLPANQGSCGLSVTYFP
jgi:hypothetical protein